MPHEERLGLSRSTPDGIERRRHVEIRQVLKIGVAFAPLALPVTSQLGDPAIEAMVGEERREALAHLGIREGAMRQQHRWLPTHVPREVQQGQFDPVPGEFAVADGITGRVA